MSDYITPLIFAFIAYVISMGIKSIQKSFDSSNDDSVGRVYKVEQTNNRPEKRTESWLSTSIYDNFLDEKEDYLLTNLQDKKEWIACDKLRPRWWDGHSEPENIWEELAKRIWSSRPEYDDSDGFEYWCNILDESKNLAWHIDKDEDEDYLVTPIMGAVYYGFNHDGMFKGGKLLTVDAQWDENENLYEKDIVPIDANFNRLVIFNASLWHRVSDFSGERYTFAVNALKQRPKRIRENRIGD